MSIFKKDPIQIIIFQSYGTDNYFYGRGRAMEDESIDLDKKGIFSLFMNSWKRFETDEIKWVNLNLKLQNNKILKVQTDGHGYFKIKVPLENLRSLTNEEGWLLFEMSYDDKVVHTIQNENRFPGEILIPSNEAEFGVISDIDDTILQTGVVSALKWRVFLNTFFKSPKARLTFKGAVDFYHKLHRGKSGKNSNPIFYVSHSPWNLYRYLEFFLKQNNFPKGPILLRSFKEILEKKEAAEKPHKQKEIVNILETYPELPFILIGDGGEHDADIYLEIAKTFQDRIHGIYLRNVQDDKKIARIRDLFKNYTKTPTLLVENSEQAIKHAQIHGFIV